MHGEFKVPGGKLVVVDLDVVDDAITNFRLAGDFFLEPDDALEDINAAINGLPANSDAKTITAAIQQSLPEGTVMLGFSAESVATAIRRALQRATTWKDYDWQIVTGPPLEPRMQMAMDQVLSEEVASGRRQPTLRIWEWNKPAVVIGSFQSLRNEVDLENAKKFGFEVVRRISGGGAMFMEAGTVITYSIYAPVELVQGMTFADSYAFLDEWVIIALKSLGIDASYQPLNDIASPTGKIGGAAQKRLGAGAVLHHVTMSYDIDGEKMVQVLRIGREKMSDKGTKSAAKRVDPLRSQTGMERADIIDAMVATFRGLHGLTESELTSDEIARAEELVTEKFGTEEWLQRVP
ncbi:lipoate--protein ligase family protein [Salinibacterium sp. NSLL150]|uniref:lipoate--protein ligase family protein n=1 Tax=unclassified Salinibacterium TaxID=2632331 RepID=UPI0018CEFC6A|nr:MULTISPECIES: biotin/lipoate A/B protein ligase family protein [unclassified Salinibacterium]MBH0097565.1 lipoate--protein ligase family protein [Salinibacterium sp. NSLL35]MBH0100320.1 lipoate--protein ligase family protein [Salinibacterium sp. NSLL150]MBH0103079.1 lipoate--protein ligase family protein [Salinibacterium sp. NSLL16]MBH0105840.1 lipoate--protein ligase family protein [Salinibacterium sp. NSLL17]MBH0110386.1 lipoate--protein ligase family protein [Salinibacterium sp. NG22]